MRAHVALLVADDPVLRALWQQLLHVHDGAWSCVHSPTGHEAVRALEQSEPSLVIADAAVPPVDVFELVERTTAVHEEVLIVLAGDNPAARHLEVGNVVRLSRVASGTTELTTLIHQHLRADDRVVDIRETDPARLPDHAPASTSGGRSASVQ